MHVRPGQGYTGTNRDTQGSTVIIRHKPSVIATTTGYSGKIRGFTGTGVSPEHHRRNWCKLSLIFTYQRPIDRVSMRFSIRRGLSRILFERRMLHVRLTFLLRSRVVSVTYQYSYEISLSYVRRIKANVLLTYAVYMAYKMYA